MHIIFLALLILVVIIPLLIFGTAGLKGLYYECVINAKEFYNWIIS